MGFFRRFDERDGFADAGAFGAQHRVGARGRGRCGFEGEGRGGLLRVLGDVDEHGAGAADVAIWNARRTVGAMSSARVTRKLCLVMGSVMPVMSTS